MYTVIFTTASKDIDFLFLFWKDTVISISTDSDKNMTGRISGILTLFQNAAKPGFIRICLVAHQLGIVLQGSYYNFGDNTFCQHLMRLILYLQRQQNLISVMQLKAPNLTDIHWYSMGKVIDWFKRNTILIDMHVNDKNPGCEILHIWWIHIMVVA